MMGIRGKLLSSYVFIGVVTLGVALWSLRATTTLDRAFDEVSDQTLPLIEALNDLRYYGLRVVVIASELALTLVHAAEGAAPALQQEAELGLTEGYQNFENSLEVYRRLLNTRGAEEDLELLDMITHTSTQLRALLFDLIELERSKASPAAMLEKLDEVEVYQTTFIFAVDAALSAEIQRFERRQADVRHAIDRTRSISVIFGPLSVLFAVLIALSLSRLIIRALLALKNASLALAAGHWDTRVPMSKDELGDVARSFNRMASALKSKNNEIIAGKMRIDGIAKSMSEALIITELDGTIRSVNSAGLRLLAYTREKIIGKNIAALFAKNCAATAAQEWLPKLKNGEALHELRGGLLDVDGHTVMVIFSAAGMREAGGTFYGVVYVLRPLAGNTRDED